MARSLARLLVACLEWRVVGERGRRSCVSTEIGKKAWLFAKLQLGRARKRINAT